MSWLDDVPVGNDDQNPYDPNQPIEREFVLAPAWRAFKAHLSAIFKRSDAEREEEYSPVYEPDPLTSRISEPERRPMHRIDEPEVSAPAVSYEPAIAEVHSREPEPVIAPFEPEPVELQEPFQEQAPLESAPVAFAEEIPESQIEPLHYEEPSRVHMPTEIQAEIPTEDNAKTIAAAVSASPSIEVPSTPSVAHATSATVLANARGESKLVAAAVAIESWANSLKTRFAAWKSSRKERRSSAQRELFVVPGSTSRTSERDRVWMQTTVAAAAIALAFLMGWIAANSRRPASSGDQAITAPVETQPTLTARDATLSPATPKSAGVTVHAGGATVQAGGVTLLPSSSVSAAMPSSTPAEPVSSKPSPARTVSHRAHATPQRHLRRSIDSAPIDDEVVVHHYTQKPSPVVSARKQTAQVKQYSDIN